MLKNTQIANREGLDTKIYDYKEYLEKGDEAKVLATIDYVNMTDISISGDAVYATGGRNAGRIVSFNNPLEGSFKLSSQIKTVELLTLAAGKRVQDIKDNTIVFENSTRGAIAPCYAIVSDTLSQDKDSNLIAEHLVFHKATAKRAFNVQYNGSGDPQSIDIEFELLTDDNKKILSITLSEDDAEEDEG